MSNQFVGRMKDHSSVILFQGSSDDLKLITKEFKFPEIEESKEVEFKTDYILHPDEWFFIELNEGEKKEMIDSYLTIIDSSADHNEIKPEQYKELLTLYLSCDKNGSKSIIFNRIFDRYCIQSKTFINIDVTGPQVRNEVNSIEFNYSVDAFWDDTKNRLYFRKYSIIKPLFSGIERYYRSASKQEVEEFLTNDFFTVSEEFNLKKLGERALHNIAAIIDSEEINFSDSDVRESYIEYANDFEAFDVHIENGKFKVEKPTDLTKILSVLQERLYISPVTKQKRVASSTSPIG